MIRGVKKFKFGVVRQEKGSKMLRTGDLVWAKNVRQTDKEGVYQKRKGIVRTAQAFVGGSLSGAPVEALPGNNGNTFMRDAGNQIWERSQSSNTWNLLGTHTRPWIETTTLQSNLYTDPRPFCCLVGTSLWSFALTTNAYEFTVTNITTGEALFTKTTVTATGIVNGSAVYDGSNVWVFWVDNLANGSVRAHKFVVTTPKTAPTATVYYTFPSSPTNLATLKLQHVEARYFSSANKVFVVASGGEKVTTTYRRGVMHSVLDPATGLAVAAGNQPATVSYAYSGSTGTIEAQSVSAPSILEGQDGSGTYWYYTVTVGDGSRALYLLNRIKVQANSFSTYTTLELLATGFAPAGGQTSVTAVGVVDNTGNGKQWIMYSYRGCDLTDPTSQIFSQLIYVDNTTIAAWTALETYANGGIPREWIATSPFYVGGKWYFITGNDSRTWARIAETSTTQRTYHLREIVFGADKSTSSAKIVGQFLTGDGPAWQFRSVTDITAPTANALPVKVSNVVVSGSKAFAAITVRAGVTGYVDLAVASVDTAKVYGKGTQIGGRAYFPGNLPVTCGNGTPLHETSPLMNPEKLTVSGGSGTDFSTAAVCYALYDQDGSVWRSAPFVISQTIGNGATLTFDTPYSFTGTTSNICVEIYLGNNAQPKLQKVYPPGTTGTFDTFTTPTAANLINGEILYTAGNALSNTWPVACQTIGAWSNRLFLAQKNKLWVSKELEQGFGPLFNEVQVSQWNEEEGDITAIGPIDWNYLAVASLDQIAVTSGAGPDGIGSGNYTLKTLLSKTGVAAGGIITQGPAGAYLQTPTTGRNVVATPSLQVLDSAPGGEDYNTYSFTSGVWYEEEGLVAFLAPASNAMLVIDYQHPTEAAPLGHVYLWTFAAAHALTLAIRDALGMLLLDSTGNVYRIGNQYVDDKSGGAETYQMDIATAPLQVDELQGEFTVSFLQTLLSMRGASGVSITTYPGYASLTAADARTATVSVTLPAPTNSGDIESVATRPPRCARIPAMSVRILEASGITSQSFEFEGLAIEYTATGKVLRPRGARII